MRTPELSDQVKTALQGIKDALLAGDADSTPVNTNPMWQAFLILRETLVEEGAERIKQARAIPLVLITVSGGVSEEHIARGDESRVTVHTVDYDNIEAEEDPTSPVFDLPQPFRKAFPFVAKCVDELKQDLEGKLRAKAENEHEATLRQETTALLVQLSGLDNDTLKSLVLQYSEQAS